MCFIVTISFISPSTIFTSVVISNIIVGQCTKKFNFFFRAWKKARKQEFEMILPRNDLHKSLLLTPTGWVTLNFYFGFLIRSSLVLMCISAKEMHISGVIFNYCVCK